jgi:hypothetical protein
MTDEILVSKTFSIYGVYTGQFILIASIVAYYCKHYYLLPIAIALYITTMLYWYYFKKGFIMYLDILLGHIAIFMVTLYYASNYFKPKYKNIWYIVALICTAVFVINQYVFYMYITKYEKLNTAFSHMVSTFVHLTFMHIMIPVTYIYCSLMSL